MAWIDAKDDPIEIPLGEVCRLACCDCGLVHDFTVERKAGGLFTIQFSRNQEATKRRRKPKSKRRT